MKHTMRIVIVMFAGLIFGGLIDAMDQIETNPIIVELECISDAWRALLEAWNHTPKFRKSYDSANKCILVYNGSGLQTLESMLFDSALIRIKKIVAEHRNHINDINAQGNTPLIIAIQKGILPAIKVFIECGVDLNMPDKNNLFPIMHAAHTCQPSLIEALRDGGADLNRCDAHGRTALDFIPLHSISFTQDVPCDRQECLRILLRSMNQELTREYFAKNEIVRPMNCVIS